MELPRFYPILDSQLVARAGLSPVLAAEAILQAGARILQFRHKGHFSRDQWESATRIADLCCEAGALFVINDRADIAALVGAALHLGQDDLLPSDARKLLPPPHAIGFSTHNESQLRAAASEPVDYLALGPIFPTSSKENPDAVVGLAELRRLSRLTGRPLVAIGGITRQTAPAVLRAGAHSIAVISDLFPPDCVYSGVRARAGEWCRIG